MINKELIKNKMADIQGYFKELQPILEENTADIIENNLKLHTVERLFQLIVDTSVDINTHIIAESDFTIPNDYQSTFIVLSENKILPMQFAVKIAPSVGLRNLIIHRYGRVDVIRMIDDIKNEINDYLEYLKLIDSYVNKE